MKPFEPRRLSLLLFLLLACAPTPDSSSTDDVLVNGQAGSPGATASVAAALTSSLWNLTRDMTTARYGHTATPLPNGKILVVGGNLNSAEIYDPTTGAWSTTGSMREPRRDHTATLLPNGKVLVAGGSYFKDGTIKVLATAEVYDPATSTWTRTGSSMRQARENHTATLLPNGKVLVVGGSGASAEVYDPVKDTWSSTSNMVWPHSSRHTATLLPGGKVLVVGGSGGSSGTERLDSAEVYDPATDTWSPTSKMAGPRDGHTATLLPNGKVLVAGGFGEGNTPRSSAELYDPVTDTWSFTGELVRARVEHSAVLLSDGKVLVMGGRHEDFSLSDDSEEYDPATGTWKSLSGLVEPRVDHTATLLSDGKLLVTGGNNDSFGLSSAELYDSPTGTWSSTGTLNQAYLGHTTTPLPDGRLLIVGRTLGDTAPNSAEVYDPATGQSSPTGPMLQVRNLHTATLLPSGKVLVVGGLTPDPQEPTGDPFAGIPVSSAELYDPVTGQWSPTGELNQARNLHTATLLPGGKVLVAGGFDHELNAVKSAEEYDPVTEQWTSTGELNQARAVHTATLLPGGKVLVVGGMAANESEQYLSSTEEYDPATRRWSDKASLPLLLPRANHTATLLPGGKVLVAGGDDGHRAVTTTALYEPATGNWSSAGQLTTARESHTATLLPGGKILVVGGGAGVGKGLLVSAEMYEPLTDAWSPAGSLNQARAMHTATLLPGGKVLVVGGLSDNQVLTSTELYTTPAGDEARRPLITRVSYTGLLENGTSFTVTGERFRGFLEASGGGTQSSATNSPLLSLVSIENPSWVPLLGHDFSDTSITAEMPSLPKGYYLLNVTTQGWTSSQMVFVAGDTRPPQPPEVKQPEPDARLYTSKPEFSGTAEPMSTVRVLVDGDELGPVTANADGTWTLTAKDLSWGRHSATVTATDAAGNTSDPPVQVSFSTTQRGVYGMSCAAAPSALSSWPWALLALGLLRRRRSP